MNQQTFLPAKNNPFSAQKVTQIPFRFELGNWETNLARLKGLDYRAAIVGNCGSGKTTLLKELGLRLQKDRHLAVQSFDLPLEKSSHRVLVSHALAASRAGCVILLDGIERLSFIQRNWMIWNTRGQAGLIINVHAACQLPTWIHCRTNNSVVDHVLESLNLACPDIKQSAISAMKLHHGNIRQVLRTLYDQYASCQFERGQSTTARDS